LWGYCEGVVLLLWLNGGFVLMNIKYKNKKEKKKKWNKIINQMKKEFL